MNDNILSNTALQIYQTGYSDESGQISSRDFYHQLKEAVIADYVHTGFCDLIDELLVTNETMVDVIAVASLIEVAKEMESVPVSRNNENPRLPGTDRVGKRLRWNDCTKKGVKEVNGADFRDLFLNIRKHGKELHLMELKTLSRNDSEQREEKEAGAQMDAAKAQFLKELQDCRSESAEMLQSRIEENNTFAAVLDEKRDEMVNQLNPVQAKILSAINALNQALDANKEDLYQNLHTWKASLYLAEQMPFAELYIDLYRIVQIDQLVSDVICNPDKDPEVMKRTVSSISMLYRTLQIFLSKYEAALPRVGLMTYRPKAGDEFDNSLHILKGGDEIPNGRIIEECLIPGVKRTVPGGDEVVIPATVTVAQMI